jgi:alpha-tubulin suppressor-like RCC1 family protein
VATGYYHSCGLTADGEAWCWGRNDHAQLGTGSSGAKSPFPVEVNTTERFQQLALGWAFTCGLAVDGRTWCWGNGEDGSLGQGAFSSSAAPVLVAGGLTFTEIVAGEAQVCGITATQSAHCWGEGSSRQLANGASMDSNVPVMVAGGHQWQAIGLGAYFGCGLTTAGALYCWGEGSDGQIPDGTTSATYPAPHAVSGGLVFAELSVAEWHACARNAAGSVWCWGWNEEGQIGDGTTNSALTPTQVIGGDMFASISASGWSTCGLLATGQAKCWGENAEGELGTGDTSDRLQPTVVLGGHSFSALSQGLGYHYCGRRTDTQYLCWGWNEYGQLANGGFVDVTTPEPLAGPPTLRAGISAASLQQAPIGRKVRHQR